MEIAKIIAPVTGVKRDAAVLATAFAAAKPFGAHVEALFVHPDPRLAVPYVGEPLAPSIVADLIGEATALAQEAAKHVQSTLAAEAEKAGAKWVSTIESHLGLSCSFREMEGFFTHSIANASKLADLVVFGPLSTLDGSEMCDAFLDVLLKVDRPVLISEEPPARFMCKASIAWDGSIAASHAVIAALPFLKRAESIDILTVYDPGMPEPDSSDLRDYLLLHGLTCSEHAIRRNDRPVAEEIMRHARERGSDLLVMGGYGHSHLKETFFGGVTQDIRWHPSIPTLMMH